MQYVISYCIVVPSTVVHHIIYIYITSDACMHAWMDGWMDGCIICVISYCIL